MLFFHFFFASRKMLPVFFFNTKKKKRHTKKINGKTTQKTRCQRDTEDFKTNKRGGKGFFWNKLASFVVCCPLRLERIFFNFFWGGATNGALYCQKRFACMGAQEGQKYLKSSPPHTHKLQFFFENMGKEWRGKNKKQWCSLSPSGKNCRSTNKKNKEKRKLRFFFSARHWSSMWWPWSKPGMDPYRYGCCLPLFFSFFFFERCKIKK